MNSLRDGDTTVCGQTLPSVGIYDCLKFGKKMDKFKKDIEEFNKSSIRIKGIGVASCWYGCGIQPFLTHPQ